MQFLTNVDGSLSADDLSWEGSQFWHFLMWKDRHMLLEAGRTKEQEFSQAIAQR